MSSKVRAFVGVCIPATPPLQRVHDELANMDRAVKPVAGENLHVTLKFLGETDTSWIDSTCDLLDDIGSEFPQFNVTLQGLGAFPKPSRPSVIWAGIVPPEPMIQLAERIEDVLTEFGFAAESRAFSPHVTLARVKARPPAELMRLLESHADKEFATLNVGEIVLMQSQLSPQGPTYAPLHTSTLL